MSSARSESTPSAAIPHPLLDPKDLQNNGKLLTDQQIDFVKKLLAKEANAVYARDKLEELISKQATDSDSKQENPTLPFRILKASDTEYFAIYKGRKWKKALGEGRNVVKLLQNLQTGKLYALKVKSEDVRFNPELEFNSLKRIGKGHGEIYTKLRKNKTGKNQKNKHYLIMELAKGRDLWWIIYDYFQHKIDIKPSRWLQICLSIALAVHELHKERLTLHRDLKLENILLDEMTDAIALTDFEFSAAFTPEHPFVDDSSDPKSIPLGTGLYKAPETFEKFYNTKTDIFALGLLFKMLLGYESCDLQDHSPYYLNKRTNQALTDADLHFKTSYLLAYMTQKKHEDRCPLEYVISTLCELENELSQKERPRPAEVTQGALRTGPAFFPRPSQGPAQNTGAETKAETKNVLFKKFDS